MLKSGLFFKKNANFTGEQRENSKYLECEILIILFLHETKHIVKLSSLY